jgi:hypothetical protein
VDARSVAEAFERKSPFAQINIQVHFINEDSGKKLENETLLT